MPVLHLIAGPHGAGKTSLHGYLVAPRHPGMPFVDARGWVAQSRHRAWDEARQADAARRWADAERQRLLVEGASFATETAFSHVSRVALIAQARALGYEVVLYALAHDDPRKLLQRVRDGGAGVPAHKVLERYARCILNLRRAVPFADLAMVIDAADVAEGGPRLVAVVTHGSIELHMHTGRPRWADTVLGFSEP